MVVCFKCSHQNPASEVFFCQNCNAILPASIDNPFTIFALTEEYQVDLEVVKTIYNELQIKLHPDNFANTDKVAELLATQHIMLINNAYIILLSPRLRSEFLLKQQGMIVNQDGADAIKPSAELLGEIFALNEQAEEMEGAEDKQQFIAYLQNTLNEISAELAVNFGAKEYDMAAVNCMKYRYFEKTLEDFS